MKVGRVLFLIFDIFILDVFILVWYYVEKWGKMIDKDFFLIFRKERRIRFLLKVRLRGSVFCRFLDFFFVLIVLERNRSDVFFFIRYLLFFIRCLIINSC